MTTSPHDAHDSDAPGHAGAHAVANAAAVADHATSDLGDAHGHDDHAHGAGEGLGPIDTMAWGAGALGVLLGLVVAACFVLATGTITG